MAKLNCAKFGNSEKRDVLNFWFCAHPDDGEQYLVPTIQKFSNVLHDKFGMQNWAIWYDTEPDSDYDESSFLDYLLPMKLFIVIVTKKFLTTDNRALAVEFKYAAEHKIPILPLMMEEGLDVLFAEKCGSLQYLVPADVSYTANPYDDKLKEYLSSFFIDDKLRSRIMKEFDAALFLSYRKIDRKYAQELMQVIHRNEAFRDVAIWYDEFLTPGEDYNKLILGEIEKSRAFVMTVTRHITERSVNAQGLPCENYIVTDEYPAAVSADVPIIPVSFDFDSIILRDNLNRKFPDIPECIPIENVGGIYGALSSALTGVELGKRKGDPTHDYLIGLAYLNGIMVEVDKNRAVALISSAAEAGCVEAMDELAMIYNIGNGIAKDKDQYLMWKLKVADYYKERLEDSEGVSEGQKYYYIAHYLNIVCQLSFAYLYEDKNDLSSALISDVRQLYDRFKDTQAASLIVDRLHGLYTLNAVLTLNDDALKEEYLLRAYEMASELLSSINSRSTVYNLSENALNLAQFYCKKGENEKAEEYFNRAEAMAERAMNMEGRIISTVLGHKHHSPDVTSRKHYCTCIYSYARFLIMFKNVDKAAEYYVKAEALAEYVVKKDPMQARSSLTIAAYVMNSLISRGDSEGAREYYLKILTVLDSLSFKKTDLSEVYELLGIYCEHSRDLSGAERFYLKALEQSEHSMFEMKPKHYAACIKLLNLLASVCRKNGSNAFAESYAAKAIEYRKLYDEIFHDQQIPALIASSVKDYFYIPECLTELLAEEEESPSVSVSVSALYKSAENYIKLAERHLSVANVAPAKQNFLKAVEVLEELCADFPDEASYADALARAREGLADADNTPVPSENGAKSERQGVLGRLFRRKKE